jgi:RES domain-containing protein
VAVPTSLIKSMSVTGLPKGWDALPYGRESQVFGHQWIEREESVVLRVPSIVNRLEFNYLINPSHPDFARIEVGVPIPFPVDPRLFG